MGWFLDEANLAQVSTNILDFEVTPLHSVYEEVRRDAEVRAARRRRTRIWLHKTWTLVTCLCPLRT